uniref:RNA ligase n=1 Tax=Candidatus Kentrum sp. FM TaxID=2126340 RepID=A0A450RZF5_9GAMM|nr:MAG: RNA ligase [Candidatus Kentron sp. FM]VFJ44970.1 MAG: RNA ligase [Candidatus Kentron sp. FM]VFK20472.1 MAG: RNA ligase [Candidatus Kentron sp. FM]
MSEYHKIQTVYKRDPATRYKTLLIGQYATPEFQYLAHNQWIFTEKVDGTNTRVYVQEGQTRFGGKTDNAQMPARLLSALDELFAPKRDELLATFKDAEVCLYGEAYGAKIQKGGGRYRQDPGFVLFDIRVGQWWLRREDVEDLAARLGIDIVPVVGHGTLDEMAGRVKAGFGSRWGDFPAEGIVARPAVELKTRAGERVIAKLKARDFPDPGSGATGRE